MAAPTADLSVTTLVLQASLPVQSVMVLLVCMSIASWAVIFRKLISIRQAKRQADAFEQAFAPGDPALLVVKINNSRSCASLIKEGRKRN